MWQYKQNYKVCVIRKNPKKANLSNIVLTVVKILVLLHFGQNKL